MMHVRSQESFVALNVTHLQKDEWAHTLVDHEVFSDIVPVKSEPIRLSHESSNCEEEQRAILDSWYVYVACEIKRSQNYKPGACELTSTAYSADMFEPLKSMNHSGPPKRFRRRGFMWKNISSRMVEQASESASFRY